MSELHRAGRLHGTTDTAAATSGAEVTVVIVPAHLTPDRYIDLSILKEASAAIGQGLRKGALVIYETTVTVGGTRGSLVPILEKYSGLKAGADFQVAYSPERVKPISCCRASRRRRKSWADSTPPRGRAAAVYRIISALRWTRSDPSKLPR
jgi:UDP-N-acetyl-D-mannosaminuronate dehydrogenase